jgi:lysophospholipase L1-like esterase
MRIFVAILLLSSCASNVEDSLEVVAPDDVGVMAASSCAHGTLGLSLGDSISVVPGYSTSFPTQYAATSSRTAIAKMAVGGRITSEILIDWGTANDITPLNLVIVNGGTNDCHPSSSNGNADSRAASALTNLQTIFTEADALSLRVISVNVPPAGTYSGWTAFSERCRDAVNLGLLSATGVDCKFDADAVLRDPGTPDNLNPAYDSGDGVHQNAAGSTALAAALVVSCGAY